MAVCENDVGLELVPIGRPPDVTDRLIGRIQIRPEIDEGGVCRCRRICEHDHLAGCDHVAVPHWAMIKTSINIATQP